MMGQSSPQILPLDPEQKQTHTENLKARNGWFFQWEHSVQSYVRINLKINFNELYETCL